MSCDLRPLNFFKASIYLFKTRIYTNTCKFFRSTNYWYFNPLDEVKLYVTFTVRDKKFKFETLISNNFENEKTVLYENNKFHRFRKQSRFLSIFRSTQMRFDYYVDVESDVICRNLFNRSILTACYTAKKFGG